MHLLLLCPICASRVGGQRKDVSLEKIFEHAARCSFSATTAKGFHTLRDQFLMNGGPALASTSRVTIDAMQALSRVRQHEDYTKAAQLKNLGVPRPRFWGNPHIQEYDLESLRKDIVEMGLVANSEFPRTEREILEAAAYEELVKHRHSLDEYLSKSKKLSIEVQHLAGRATRSEVIRFFESCLPGKVPGDRCIVYAVERDWVAKVGQVSFRHQRNNRSQTLPHGAGIPGAVLEAGRSVQVQDIFNDKTFYAPLETGIEGLGYPRESAIASPCFNAAGEVNYILEVTSGTERARYAQKDSMLLEYAGALLMQALARTRVAEECAEIADVRDRVVDCARLLNDAVFIHTINKIADNCCQCVHGGASRVWLVRRDTDEIYVNTDDEAQAEIAPITAGSLGAAVHSQVSTRNFAPGYLEEDEPVSFACVPIIDRRLSVLGVLELNQKRDPTTKLVVPFSKDDEALMHAFAVLLANFIEHSQFFFTLRPLTAGMEHIASRAEL